MKYTLAALLSLVSMGVMFPGNSIAADPFADAFALPPSGLTLIATVSPEKAAPGDKIQVEVTLTNETSEKRSFDIPSMWWARSDQASVVFPSWPRMGGLGPVITYRQVELEPGKSWSRTWPATIAQDAKEGALEFKIGLSLKRMNQDFKWSNPIKNTILPKASGEPATPPPTRNASTNRPGTITIDVRNLQVDSVR
jgi:hypothetical protein